jgi:hypothetical protein
MCGARDLPRQQQQPLLHAPEGAAAASAAVCCVTRHRSVRCTGATSGLVKVLLRDKCIGIGMHSYHP